VRARPADASPLLAVYGTLRRGYRNWPLLQGRSALVAVGTLPGRLVHVDSPLRRYPYPGYLPTSPDSPLPEISGTLQSVVVEVLRIDDPALWPALDALERYLPENAADSEYVRVLVTVTTHGGTALTSWTYRYNAAVASYRDVPDGDWARLYPPDLPGDVEPVDGTNPDVTTPDVTNP
jgi:gamma-glutamylcyclotransferase (GGCT)/AIG2-like uncharacterized protein YtfP